jgi:DNA-binding protein H-NS
VNSIHDLIEQKLKIDLEIERHIQNKKSEIIFEIKEKIAQYKIKPEDIFSSAKKQSREIKIIPKKYRNPSTGEEWTGRGRAPHWIRDELVWDKFLIRH